MLIDPWDVIKGTFWLLVLMILSEVAVLYVAVKVLIWAYRGSAWLVAHTRRHGG